MAPLGTRFRRPGWLTPPLSVFVPGVQLPANWTEAPAIRPTMQLGGRHVALRKVPFVVCCAAMPAPEVPPNTAIAPVEETITTPASSVSRSVGVPAIWAAFHVAWA